MISPQRLYPNFVLVWIFIKTIWPSLECVLSAEQTFIFYLDIVRWIFFKNNIILINNNKKNRFQNRGSGHNNFQKLCTESTSIEMKLWTRSTI